MSEQPSVPYEGFQMPLAEAMTTQRAIRRVKPDPVDDALVLRLIELALKGPTAQNQQGWEFIVVKDPEVKRKLARQNRLMWRLYRPIARLRLKHGFSRGLIEYWAYRSLSRVFTRLQTRLGNVAPPT